MKFSDFLKPESIQIHLKASNKEEVIRSLVNLAARSCHFEKPEEILKVVLDREALMSTGVGKGVAIPHGKADCVLEVGGGLVILDEGVDFDSPDGLPVRIAILLLSSTKETGPHIRALAHISRAFQDEKVREGLLQAKSSKEALDVLLQKEASL